MAQEAYAEHERREAEQSAAAEQVLPGQVAAETGEAKHVIQQRADGDELARMDVAALRQRAAAMGIAEDEIRAATTEAARSADRAYQPTPEDEHMALMSLVMQGMETEQFAEIVKSAEAPPPADQWRKIVPRDAEGSEEFYFQKHTMLTAQEPQDFGGHEEESTMSPDDFAAQLNLARRFDEVRREREEKFQSSRPGAQSGSPVGEDEIRGPEEDGQPAANFFATQDKWHMRGRECSTPSSGAGCST